MSIMQLVQFQTNRFFAFGSIQTVKANDENPKKNKNKNYNFSD